MPTNLKPLSYSPLSAIDDVTLLVISGGSSSQDNPLATDISNSIFLSLLSGP